MTLGIYEICALTAVICFAVITVYLVLLLNQARHTAKAVEKVARHAEKNIERTDAAFTLVENIAGMMNSTLFKVFGLGLTAFKTAKSFKKHRDQEDD